MVRSEIIERNRAREALHEVRCDIDAVAFRFLNECIDRETEMPPRAKFHRNGIDWIVCPGCGSDVEDRNDYGYCPFCGQRLGV